MFSEKIHRYIFLFGVVGLAFGMMIGTVPTSVPQIILFANWLLEGNFSRKWLQLRSNKIFWALSALYLVHVLGVFYSNDLHAGLKDIKTKMPLMFLPMLFFSTGALTKTEWRFVLNAFIAGCVADTMWCLVYSFVLHHNERVRDASRFMSHIRLGLYLNLAIACCVYFCSIASRKIYRFLYAALIVYFIMVLYLLGLASGLANFFILLFLFLLILSWRQNMKLKIVALVAGILTVTGITLYVKDVKSAQLDVRPGVQNTFQRVTLSGRGYIHLDSLGQKENGNYTLINIQPQELQAAWNKEFPDDSFSYSPSRNIERFHVLVRYMASKGLLKDSAGYAKLSDTDKLNISRNIPNYQYSGWSFLRKRTYELVNEFDEFRNSRSVNGHSLTMRLYFWKAALHVVKRNLWFGVGTGDVQDELNKAYVDTHSPLEKEWYKRPHNQFLTVTVALGMMGLVVFLFSIVYPIGKLYNKLHVLFWPFLILAIVSFFLEDTIETQAGLTFYAFFNSFFIVNAFHGSGTEITGTKE